MSLAGWEGSAGVSAGSSCPRPRHTGAHVPPQLYPLLTDLRRQGRKKKSLEGLKSAYCIYLVVLFSCEESRPTVLKQCCSPGG